MSIYKKLLAVKKAVPYLQKDKPKGNGLQYSYVTPGAVLSAVNPLLNEHGLFLKTEVVRCTTTRIFAKKKYIDVYNMGQKESVMIDVHETLFDLDLKFTFVDTDSDDQAEFLFSASGVNGDEKGLGSALTYAERYFLLKTFNIPTDDDDPDAFQTKHMSEEDKKAANDTKLKESNAKAAAEIEKRTAEINDAVKKLANCETVDELKMFKDTLPEYIVKSKAFTTPATARYNEIKTA